MAMDPDEIEKASHEMLEDAVARVAAETANSPRSVGLVASEGGPAQVLLEAAVGADLLVVGSRGRAAIRTIVAGSVAQGCARHGPCPVVVVRPKPAA